MASLDLIHLRLSLCGEVGQHKYPQDSVCSFVESRLSHQVKHGNELNSKKCSKVAEIVLFVITSLHRFFLSAALG